jgi:hypothetical protein
MISLLFEEILCLSRYKKIKNNYQTINFEQVCMKERGSEKLA